MLKYYVTAVDNSDCCDGKARILGAFNTRDEAVKFVREDIDEWCKVRIDNGIIEKELVKFDYDKMYTSLGYPNFGWESCDWNIEELDLEKNSKSV